jgi:sec-independent protein translocase protein TatC
MTTPAEKATFWEHLEELRKTLIRSLFFIVIGIILCFCFHKQLFEILVSPLDEELVILGPAEGFATMLKLSFWGGVVLTAPFWLYSVIQFVKPALQHREKEGLIPFIFLSALFATTGTLFAWSITIPIANEALQTFNAQLGQNMWSLHYYFDYTLTLLLAHAFAFELAAVILFLLHHGFISSKALINSRAYALLTIFILAAILTPPDIITQLMLALPMAALYELMIFYGKIREKIALKNKALQSK